MGDRVGSQFNKRDFLKLCGTGVCALFALPAVSTGQALNRGSVKPRLSPYFTSLEGGKIQCTLCPRQCRVSPGKRGACRVRENRQGKYYSLVYGNPCAVHLDPIEKKPFFHLFPSTGSLSIATVGCNFQCKFCQNWEISQAAPEDVENFDFPPEAVVEKAKEMGARSVAYTYVEPTIFYEYMLDTARQVRKAGLLNVYHSNGYIQPDALRNLCKVLDGANIDLKGFTESFYQELCAGELAPVLNSLRILKEEKVHLEITNLVIPTKNDDMAVIRDMCAWIKKELGPDTPLHFSRFYPLYKLRSLPPTPVSLLEAAREAAQSAGLEYVYVGNVPGHEGEHTYCPRCKKLLIRRKGFIVAEVRLKDGKCGFCGKPIPGRWA